MKRADIKVGQEYLLQTSKYGRKSRVRALDTDVNVKTWPGDTTPNEVLVELVETEPGYGHTIHFFGRRGSASLKTAGDQTTVQARYLVHTWEKELEIEAYKEAQAQEKRALEQALTSRRESLTKRLAAIGVPGSIVRPRMGAFELRLQIEDQDIEDTLELLEGALGL